MAFSSFFVVSNSLRLRNFGRVTTAPEGENRHCQTFSVTGLSCQSCVGHDRGDRRPSGVQRVVDLGRASTVVEAAEPLGDDQVQAALAEVRNYSLLVTGQFAQHVVVGRQVIVIAGVLVPVRATAVRRPGGPTAPPGRSPPSAAVPARAPGDRAAEVLIGVDVRHPRQARLR